MIGIRTCPKCREWFDAEVGVDTNRYCERCRVDVELAQEINQDSQGRLPGEAGYREEDVVTFTNTMTEEELWDDASPDDDWDTVGVDDFSNVPEDVVELAMSLEIPDDDFPETVTLNTNQILGSHLGNKNKKQWGNF